MSLPSPEEIPRRAEEAAAKAQAALAGPQILDAMFPALALRILRTTDPRLLGKFMWNFGVKGMLSVERFKRRIKRGEYFPPFLYLSILNPAICAARAAGWMSRRSATQIDLETLNRTINDAKAHGNAFFGILGGEPFMHPELLDLLAAHPDCYFQVFTNGQFITDKIAKRAAADRQRHAAHLHRRPRDRERRAARQEGGLQRGRCAGSTHCLREQHSHRRGDERLPDEYRRPAAPSRGCAS